MTLEILYFEMGINTNYLNAEKLRTMTRLFRFLSVSRGEAVRANLFSTNKHNASGWVLTKIALKIKCRGFKLMVPGVSCND